MVGLESGFSDAPAYVASNDLGTAVLLGASPKHDFAARWCSPRAWWSTARAATPAPRMDRCDRFRAPRQTSRPGASIRSARAAARPSRRARFLETAAPDPRSVYATTKLAQEQLCGIFARERSVRAFALRYHNVYGPRMPRDTPYAGVASLFLSALVAGRVPAIFEDGAQLRDFVHVRDVARADAIALLEEREGGAYNIASGRPRSVGEMARRLAGAWGGDAPSPRVTGELRLGDVRHVFADPARAAAELGFETRIGFGQKIRQLATAQLREPARRSPDRVEEKLDGECLEAEQHQDEAQPAG